eukprot:scaffold12109_cov101-Isochrysis_galbana.AAC.2
MSELQLTAPSQTSDEVDNSLTVAWGFEEQMRANPPFGSRWFSVRDMLYRSANAVRPHLRQMFHCPGLALFERLPVCASPLRSSGCFITASSRSRSRSSASRTGTTRFGALPAPPPQAARASFPCGVRTIAPAQCARTPPP